MHGLSPSAGSSTQSQQDSNLTTSSTITTERWRSNAVLPTDAVLNLENSPSIIPRRLSLQRVKMATAKFKSHFHAPHGPKLFRTNSSNHVSERPVDEEQKKKEKDFIACFECNGPPLTPDQIAEKPRSKEVGCASKQLRVGDFELIKTIGTGNFTSSVKESLSVSWVTNYQLGTFARVWLSCLAGSQKDRQKVFALKILRKVDSTYMLAQGRTQYESNVSDESFV